MCPVRSWLPRSISTRVTLATLLAVSSVIGGASFFLDASLARLFQKEGNRELQEKATVLVERLDLESWPDEDVDVDEASPKVPEKPKLDRDVLEDTEHLLVRVLDDNGATLLESEGMARLLPQAKLPPMGTWQWKDVDGPTGAQFLVYAQKHDHGWVLTAWDIRHENRLLQKSRDLLIYTWTLAALAAALLTVLLTRRGLSPVEGLARKAEDIRPGALHLDLDASHLPSELQLLAERLQGALARLDEAFGRLTTLNADVAHELRTPLHGMRLEIEGLLREGAFSTTQEDRLEGVLETLDHLAATLDQMLFLARAEDPSMALQIKSLDVPNLLRAAASPFEPLAEEKRVTLHLHASEGLALRADEVLVRRALHNLLTNAIRHAPEGSTVTVEGLAEPGAVVLQVKDTGEGIPAAFLERIGQRFVRPDHSRSRASGGAGLGLAIVSSILRLHGGRLELQSEEGRGTLARLRFPA